jgi:hypothetical protein
MLITRFVKYLLYVRNKIKKILKESILKKDYRMRMIYGTSIYGESKDDWTLYDSLVSELRKIGDDKHIDEIRYRISDDEEEPISIVNEILSKIKNKNKELKVIEEKVINRLVEKINTQIRYDHQH